MSVHIVTLQPPLTYPKTQLDQAVTIAHVLDRGRLVLVEPPRR